MEPLLRISSVSKSFGETAALRGVSFAIDPGECLALVGENGAGKSTLMKILSGVWPHGTYGGEIYFNKELLKLSSPLDGRKKGISIIHQELCLFPQLSVAENIFLTEKFPYSGEPSLALFSRVRWDVMENKALDLFQRLGFDLPAREKVENLSVAGRQLVEIARAIHHRAKLLILDEPTSALSKKEVGHLFQAIQKLQKEGMSFIYISHKLDEVLVLSRRLVVLRDGVSVAECVSKDTSESEVIRHMVGRPLEERTKKRDVKGHSESCFEVRAYCHRLPSGRVLIQNIEFTVKRGEILGLGGLMGSGRSAFLRSLLGLIPGDRTGEVKLGERRTLWKGVRQAMNDGVAFLPEDRKKDGLFLDLGIDFNISLAMLGTLGPWYKVDETAEKKVVREMERKMSIKFSQSKNPIRTLSGGNQQKVLLGRSVARRPKLLILDEPTRGIDVRSKEEVYEIIFSLVSEGVSVLLVSSELPELFYLSDRILVMREGCIVGNLGQNENPGDVQEQFMRMAAGVT